MSAGRVRISLPPASAARRHELERDLRALPGVRAATISDASGRALVEFDPQVTDVDAIRAALPVRAEEPRRPRAVLQAHDGRMRTRIAARGLDRDPAHAQRIVAALRARPGVHHVRASPLTGRVLVEFSSTVISHEDLVAQVVGFELPDLPPEDGSAHPLDPEPLIESGGRLVGAAAGLAVTVVRRLRVARGAPVRGMPEAAAALGLVEAFPVLRRGLARLLGHTQAELVFGGIGAATLALSNSPLGLLVSGGIGLRFFTAAHVQRRAWLDYERRSAAFEGDIHEPGAELRLRGGERAPLQAIVREGTGTGVWPDGLRRPVRPGDVVPGGARLHGGPFRLELRGTGAFTQLPRPLPEPPGWDERYVAGMTPLSLGFALLTAVVTRSARRAFVALLLLNPRPALVGAAGANVGAAARATRAAVMVVGARREHAIRRQDVLVVDCARVVAEDLEIAGVRVLDPALEPAAALDLAGAVDAAAGSPWGPLFRGAHGGVAASGCVLEQVGLGRDLVLALRRGDEPEPLALLELRPRLRTGLPELVAACAAQGTQLLLVGGGEAGRRLARRAGVDRAGDGDALAVIRRLQRDGLRVGLLTDRPEAGAALAASDLGIALVDVDAGPFAARADILASGLGGVAALVDAGRRRELAVRDGVLLSLAANLAGAVWGLRSDLGVRRGPWLSHAAALAALADGWLRLRGGARPSALARFRDPRPERWGERPASEVLAALRSSPAGLDEEDAARRRRAARVPAGGRTGFSATAAQLASPLTLVLALGAATSFALGALGDVLLIAAVIAANSAVTAWEEGRTGRAAEALQELTASRTRVVRGGRETLVPTASVVAGDVLLLASGDRVGADARVLQATGLEVDESSLTGEAEPDAKAPDAPRPDQRIVLDGSDVTVGTGLVVAFAVGEGTRLGATRAVLEAMAPPEGRLAARLSRMLWELAPVVVAGAALVVVAGLLRRRAVVAQLALGTSVGVAAVPEGLPLLAGVAEASVARRLADRRALVRRLAAVEALGRIDVACIDKTGTLTEGRPAVRLVADVRRSAAFPGPLPPGPEAVLAAAALASPPPDAGAAAAHPTDRAVLEAAALARLAPRVRLERDGESPFDPVRPFHATLVGGVAVKGAVEVLVPRCARVRVDGEDRPLDERGRRALLARAERLAARGLRVLLVAEGPVSATVDDPRGLTALGFVGIADRLRDSARDAVERCQRAGVRLIMLTGDHPATARAVAEEIGLIGHEREPLLGRQLAELDADELDESLERAAVAARITPLDKLRIIESLQRSGHTVAMTGDGVNDAPALRLADVGVAMGRSGSDVAREAADVVLADDDVATLVEALVEGRGFWRNVRRALGLLLGGNLGELGLMAPASLLVPESPLTTRQVLAVNLVTDVLPALAVAVQEPVERDLGTLSREGLAALGDPLRRDVLRRALATALPSLAAFLLARRGGGAGPAQSVAFGSVVATQLAQTLDLGRTGTRVDRTVLGAVAASTVLLGAMLAAPRLRRFLELQPLGPAGALLVVGSALAAPAVSRVLRP